MCVFLINRSFDPVVTALSLIFQQRICIRLNNKMSTNKLAQASSIPLDMISSVTSIEQKIKIDAILVAEFDIDVGSSITQQHPANFIKSNVFEPAMNEKYTTYFFFLISTRTVSYENERECVCSSFAELMLPDGAHLRDEDWTYAILKQPEGGKLTADEARYYYTTSSS